MRQRGRKSQAALAVISSNGIETIRRPEPLEELTDEQAVEWRAVVNRMPAEWFPRETHAMLAAYCRHVVSARRVAQLVQQAEMAPEFDIDGYEQLLRMQDREGRALSLLATRMRLSQTSTMRVEQVRGRMVQLQRKPWDED
jgi:hypothetical protein